MNPPFFLVVLALVLAQPALAAPLLSEVHARTPEWLEVWNPDGGSLNLSTWQIADSSTNNPDTLTCWDVPGCSLTTSAPYFLILGRDTDISAITNSSVSYFYVDDQRIGNGLNDGGDTLHLFNSSYESNYSYPNSTTGISWAFVSGSWIDCEIPSPGLANSCAETNTTSPPPPTPSPQPSPPPTTPPPQPPASPSDVQPRLAVYLSSPVEAGATYTKLFKIEFIGKADCSIKEPVTVFYTVSLDGAAVLSSSFTRDIGCSGYADTGAWTPAEVGTYHLCGHLAGEAELVCANITTVCPAADCPAVAESSTNDSHVEVEAPSARFSLLSSPEFARANEVVDISVSVENLLQQEQTFAAYSYVYSASRLLSEGWANDIWKGGWDANRLSVTVPAGETAVFSLRNLIKDDTAPGLYSVRVRFADHADLDSTILVKPDPVVSMECAFADGVVFVSLESQEALNTTLNVEGMRPQSRELALDGNLTIGVRALPDSLYLLWNNKTLASCSVAEATASYRNKIVVEKLVLLEDHFPIVGHVSRLLLAYLAETKS